MLTRLHHPALFKITPAGLEPKHFSLERAMSLPLDEGAKNADCHLLSLWKPAQAQRVVVLLFIQTLWKQQVSRSVWVNVHSLPVPLC